MGGLEGHDDVDGQEEGGMFTRATAGAAKFHRELAVTTLVDLDHMLALVEARMDLLTASQGPGGGMGSRAGEGAGTGLGLGRTSMGLGGMHGMNSGLYSEDTRSMVLGSVRERTTIIPMLLRRGLFLEALELSLETKMMSECPQGLQQVMRALAAQCATCQASLGGEEGGPSAALKLQAASMWKLLEHAVKCSSSTPHAFASQETVRPLSLAMSMNRLCWIGAWARGCVDGCLCFLLWLFIPVVASEDQWLKDRWISSHDYVSYYFPCLHCVPHPSFPPSLYQAVDSMLRVHPDLAIPQWLLNSIVHGSRRSVGSRGSAGNEQGLLRVLISHGRLAEACHIAVSLVGRISGSLGQHQAGDPQGGSHGGGTGDSARAIQFLPVTLMDQLITACAADVSVTFEFLYRRCVFSECSKHD